MVVFYDLLFDIPTCDVVVLIKILFDREHAFSRESNAVNLLDTTILLSTYLEGLKNIGIFEKLVEISCAEGRVTRVRLGSTRVLLASLGSFSRFLQSFLPLAFQFLLRLSFLLSLVLLYLSRLIITVVHHFI